ncbi:hypothetical protein PG999_000412 [Apiospora kogelbergensis]|uniref:Ankyrin repeat n=1 Tax=Apiospora kogelbergensis TaxID=1337665 RepID=A0AAW0RBQ9_9PEZI
MGSHSVSLILPEAIAGSCNQLNCRSRSTAAAYVECRFPTWFAKAIIWANFCAPNLFACSLEVRGVRVVPDKSPIFQYAIEGDLDGIRRLFQDGQASVYDTSETTGTSVLGYATDRGHQHVWRFLLEHGADPYVESKLKDSPVDVACTKLYTTPMSSLISSADTSMIMALARDFETEEYIEERQFPSLHKIVLGIVDADLETQLELSIVDINATDNQGRTALLWAAIRGDVPVIQTLIRFGADQRPALNGSTPLHYAVQAHTPDAIQVLLDHGADVAAKNAWNVTPLHYAAANRDDVAYVLPLLAAPRADLNACDYFGHSALVRAVHLNRPRIVERLLAKGAALVESDIWGSDPLAFAMEKGFVEVARSLIRWSNSIDRDEKQLRSCVSWAHV